MPPAQLNELLSEFIFTVRTKHGMTMNAHRGRGKDSASYPTVLMKIKGDCYKNYHILIFLNYIFILVIFKTEVVQFSLQVFIRKFAMPFVNLIFKMLIIFVFFSQK